MSNDDLVLGLTVFIVVLMLIDGLRISLSMLDDALPPLARLRDRLRDAGPLGWQPGDSIVRKGRLSDARLLRQRLSCFAFAGAVEKLLAQAGMRIKGALFLLTLGLAGLPSLLALHRRRKRLARMEAQLPAALDLLCSALRAGHALPSVLRLVADESGGPLADEFRILVDEVGYGASLADSLRRMALRNPGGDIGCFVVAVLIQRDIGGDLAELLAGIAVLIRERRKLHGQIRVHMADASLPAWILGLLLLVLAAGLHLAHPQFISLLWTDDAGRRALPCA
jgi:tight adherence protein B